MRSSRQARRTENDPTFAVVRSNRRTSVVVTRLAPGDIAVIHQIDLDTGMARQLLDRQPSAVVNTAPFVSGRVANLGPGMLLDAGVVLVEAADADVDAIRDGARLRLDDGTLYDGDQPIVTGTVLTRDELDRRMEAAREGLATQLGSFTSNAAEYLRRDEDVLLHGRGLPVLRSRFADRPVVVIGGATDPAELRGLRRYLREQHPAVIAVDGGAQVAARGRLRPDVVVVGEETLAGLRDGQMPVPQRPLKRARDVVVHTRRPGDSPGTKRLVALGVEPVRFTGTVNSFDVGLLLAHHGGAGLVIPVGSRSGLDDLVEGSRAEQASTFLTRLRLGPRLVDAAVVPQLYSGRTRWWYLLVVLLAGLLAVAVAVASTPVGQDWWDQIRSHLHLLITKG